MTKTRVLSGARPTGMLHLGNYWGAIKQFIDLQNNEDIERYYFVADLHSLTTIDYKPINLNKATIDLAKGYIACGLDPSKTTIYAQSAIEKIAILTLLLGMFTSESWLRKCTTFKDKSKKQETISIGLLNYPVMMTADIIIMQADIVPVGHDQLQHLEMARDIALKFNSRFGNTFKLPKATNLSAVRVPSLNGKGKMGKSDQNYIGLFESSELINKKVLSAVTDSGPVDNGEMSQYMKNLYFILKLHAPEDIYQKYLDLYNQKNQKFYGQLKKDLAKYILELLEPFRKRYFELTDDYIIDVLQTGANKANIIAEKTFADVSKHLQL